MTELDSDDVASAFENAFEAMDLGHLTAIDALTQIATDIAGGIPDAAERRAFLEACNLRRAEVDKAMDAICADIMDYTQGT
jgi:hypothetical protein